MWRSFWGNPSVRRERKTEVMEIMLLVMLMIRPLGGSRVLISGAISRVTIVITHIRGFLTRLITTHEPPSKSQD